jgi:hypothetical protein
MFRFVNIPKLGWTRLKYLFVTRSESLVHSLLESWPTHLFLVLLDLKEVCLVSDYESKGW